MGCTVQQPIKQLKPITISQPLSRYLRQQLIGTFANSQFYHCIDTLTNIPYAMKVIKIGKQIKQQLTQLKSSLQLLKKLNHPNIIKYEDIIINANNQQVQIIMEMVENGSLKSYNQKNGPLSQTLCAEIGAKILKALNYLHAQNAIHRDLKCSNILLTEQLQPKLSDFGILKLIPLSSNSDQLTTLSSTLKGTPFYMPPQLLKHLPPTPPSDIWSFGCTLIEMLSSKPPWSIPNTKSSEILKYITEGVHPPFPPNISRQCSFFLESCFDPIPTKRLTAFQLSKHRFIDKLGVMYEGNKKNRVRKLSVGLSTKIVQQPTSQLPQNHNNQTKVQSPQKQNINKKYLSNSIQQNYQLVKNKQFDINTQILKYHQKLSKIPIQSNIQHNIFNSQSNQLSPSHQQLAKDKNYIAKTLINLKKKKYGNNIHRLSTSLNNASVVSMNLGVISSPTSQNLQNYQQRTNQLTDRDEIVINTMISTAERNQFLEQQRYYEKQREQEKQKWEQQLKAEAELLRKDLSRRYFLIKF